MVPSPSKPAGRKIPDAGFTLLELLVVVIILGLLTAVIPSALAGLPSMRLRAAATALAETLRQAHDDAIDTGRPVDVFIDLRQRSYAATGQKPVCVSEAVDEITATRDAPGRQDEKADFRFFADGSATSGTIMLRHAQRRAIIVVDWVTGRVRVDA